MPQYNYDVKRGKTSRWRFGFIANYVTSCIKLQVIIDPTQVRLIEIQVNIHPPHRDVAQVNPPTSLRSEWSTLSNCI